MTTLRSLRSLAAKSLRGKTAWTTRSSSCLPPGRSLSTRPQVVQEWEDTTPNVDEMLSFRNYAMKSPQFKFPDKKLSLQGFLKDLPKTLEIRQEILDQDPMALEGKEDPVLALFRKLKLKRSDWAPYAHFDPTKAYTRNLIYTDNEHFTLLLLCWNVDAESKIHDHPCDGCWLQVLQGEVQECRYEYPPEGADGYLKCIADERFHEGEVAFINDSIGLHKVGNPGRIPAVTLHLYHPPFSRCKVWDDSSSGSASKGSCATHFSEYGWVEGSYLP